MCLPEAAPLQRRNSGKWEGLAELECCQFAADFGIRGAVIWWPLSHN